MSIESRQDLDGLREAGRTVRLALDAMARHVRSGITTADLNAVGAEVLRKHGARSAPMLVYGFPAEVCISVNEEIVHGIPSERMIEAGDLVKLDVVAEKDGYVADAATTVVVSPAPEAHHALAACARRAFERAMTVARAGNRVFHIGRAVERTVRANGFSVVRELAGHGVGRTIHEAPDVPNYPDPRARQRLTEGLVITVEPMITAAPSRPVEAADGWTIRTASGTLAAHYEHTLVITRGAPLLLTA
jgi:methionyl aminopeptidase